MGAQHTRGPWTVEDSDYPLVGADAADGTEWIICDLGLPCDLVGLNPENLSDRILSERAANARLIAAAPDMLIALEQLTARVAELEGDLNDGLNEAVRAYYGHVTPALAFAQRIAAKARGEA